MTKYNPVSKEFQEEAKRLGLNGYQYYRKLVEEGKLPNPTDVKRKENDNILKKKNCTTWPEYFGYKNWTEYRGKCVQKLGYKDWNEYQREWRYDTGRSLPMEVNDSCSSYFGIYIGENYMMKTFEDSIPMPHNNPGYDWICNKRYKIQHKARCLYYSNDTDWKGWTYPILNNNIADYFMLSAWDNRESLTPLHVWIFYKDDIVRGRKFWERESFTITNMPDKIKEFENWEATDRLEKLKELCRERKCD